MRILAGIVLFNPDIQRLRENVEAIENQVDGIAFFNNGEQIPQEICNNNVVLPNDNGNVGIAKALNKLCQYAMANGYDWILTLDQDSVCPKNLIIEYKKYTADPVVGMVSPRILDRNCGLLPYDGTSDEIGAEEIDVCITSAALLRLSAWEAVNGFWEALFIDMVDFDICWALQRKGYKILRVKSTTLLHEVGHGKKVHFKGKDEVVFNHPPVRTYYMTRNTIAVGRKYKRLNQCLHWIFKRILLINCYEKNRWEKNKSFLKGFFEGFIMEISC